MVEALLVKQSACAPEELTNNRLRWMMYGVVCTHRTDKGNGLRTLRTSLVEITDLRIEEEEEGVFNPKESFGVQCPEPLRHQSLNPQA